MDELELKHIAPYLPYGLKVQYEGILNGKELKEYDKSEPVLSDPYSEEYIEFWRNRREDIGLKISKIKEVKFYNNYIKFYVGRHHGYLKPLYLGDFKPILRPLSLLIKEIEINGEKFVPSSRLYRDFDLSPNYYGRLGMLFNGNGIDDPIHGYLVVNKLFEWHFDVFGLIEKGLAIDINTL